MEIISAAFICPLWPKVNLIWPACFSGRGIPLSLSGKTKAFPLDFICFPVFSAPRQVWLQNFSRSAAGNKCWPGIFHPRNFHLAIFNVSNQLFPATVCLAFCHLAVGYLNIVHAAKNTETYFLKNVGNSSIGLFWYYIEKCLWIQLDFKHLS